MSDLENRLADYGRQLDELCSEITIREIEQRLFDQQEATVTTTTTPPQPSADTPDLEPPSDHAHSPNRRRILAVVAAAILVVAIGVIATRGGDDNSRVITEEVPFEPTRLQQSTLAVAATGTEIEGTLATLRSNSELAEIEIKSSGLEPGNAFTAWLFVVDMPTCNELVPRGSIAVKEQVCATIIAISDSELADIGILGGATVEADGTLTITGTVRRDGLANAWFDKPLGSFEQALFHVRLKDHGPPIEGLTDEMTSTYRGGCLEADEIGVPDKAVNDGTPGPNPCFEVQKATLAPEQP